MEQDPCRPHAMQVIGGSHLLPASAIQREAKLPGLPGNPGPGGHPRAGSERQGNGWASPARENGAVFSREASPAPVAASASSEGLLPPHPVSPAPDQVLVPEVRGQQSPLEPAPTSWQASVDA